MLVTLVADILNSYEFTATRFGINRQTLIREINIEEIRKLGGKKVKAVGCSKRLEA